jgi:hypothetical protein
LTGPKEEFIEEGKILFSRKLHFFPKNTSVISPLTASLAGMGKTYVELPRVIQNCTFSSLKHRSYICKQSALALLNQIENPASSGKSGIMSMTCPKTLTKLTHLEYKN